METLLCPGYEKILVLFHEDKRARIHLRKIARKARMNENSASRFLKQLEEQRILTAEKDGNLKKYHLRPNPLTYAIFSYMDIKKLNSLPSIRKNAIHTFLSSLKDKPIMAILFGSTARGTYAKDSDIDILAIVNKKIEIEGARQETESQTTIRVNLIQISYHTFIEELRSRRDPVIQSAIATGFPIFGHVEYYEVYYRETQRP